MVEDKKLTDSEIVKALNCVLQLNNGLDKNNAIIALDLINRLQKENERLKEEVAKEFTCFVGDPHKVEHCPYLEQLKTAKAEAYKEILNFLENKFVCKGKLTAMGYESAIIDIKNHLKELVGEDNGKI